MEKRILIAGGGTGGHVYPALAIIEALQAQGQFRFLYVGAQGGIETRIVPDRGIPMETITVSGFARRFSYKNILFPLKLMISLMQSRRILKSFDPHLAIGTGGYVTGPILYMAARRHVPVLIQEQDVHPGVTTRLLARYARIICLAFAAAGEHLRRFEEKLRVTGNPVRRDLLATDRAAALQKWGFQEDRLTLFVFGGSQGARSINQAMAGMLPDLMKQYPLQVLWQTGEKQWEATRERIGDPGEHIRLLPYIGEMNAAYAAADLIVCRAGASTLAELALVGVPAILVPYPYAAGRHQEHNSRIVAEAGAATMVTEGPEWEKRLLVAIRQLLDDPQLRARQRQSWKKLAQPDAAARIAAEALRLITES